MPEAHESSANASRADISYPNAGVPGQVTPWGPYIVLAAEKHDAGPAYPSFDGTMDEFRVWNVALSPSQVLDAYDRVVAPNAPGLVAYYRFEEGSGTTVADSSVAASPAGLLIAGIPGNGEWVSFASDPAATAPVSSGSLPAGFQRTTIASGLEEPTVIAFAPGGRLFIGERGGRIRVWQGGMLLPDPLVQIPANTLNGERGLVGLAIDPAFALNGYLYAYYTTNEPRNRIGRFTVVGDTASLGSEVVVWQNPDLAADYHHGGAIAFGPEGDLYIATGDQFDSANSQDLGTQHGKILRVEPDGTIPPDNPFVGVSGAEAAIWAYGLRNPFRMSFDAILGTLWIGDVGGNNADSWEEAQTGASGANYGWPIQEGPVCYSPPCAGVTFPLHAYRHDDPRYSAGEAQGSITMGPVYRATSFPVGYRGNVFFGDYANRWIRRLVLAPGGGVAGDPLFLRQPDAGTIVELEVGPDGALYYVTIGVPWSGSPDIGAVHRIAFVGTGNQPPVAVASADTVQGPAPLAVEFNGSGSYDPDNRPGPLTYDWTFGDGGGSTQANPQHVYSANGLYTAQLVVSDGGATSSPAELTITVGLPPTATITAPPAGTTYRAGDIVTFAGTGTDPEDGPLGPAAFQWRIVQRHADHVHPFLGPLVGIQQGQFTVPSMGHAPEGTDFEVQLTVTDSDGLPATDLRAIVPVLSPIAFDTGPSGIPIYLDGAPLTTPRVYESLVGFVHAVEAQATSMQGGTVYTFGCWSDGGARVHAFTAPEGGGTLTAHYTASSQSQTVTPTVSSQSRNADYFPTFGEELANAYDAFGLCVGRESDGGTWQAGVQFALNVPRVAVIASASLRIVATSDTSGDPVAQMRAYDVAAASPFSATHTHPLTAHQAMTSTSVTWTLPPFAAGQTYDSPDLAALVQAVVDRPDWTAGAPFGLVLDGSASAVGNHWRCFRNAASGEPAQLTVTYAVPSPSSLAPPGATGGLAFAVDKVSLAWTAAPLATAHDLLRGSTVLPFTYDHTCRLEGLPSASASDSQVPPAATGLYYLSRGTNLCGPGTVGSSSGGAARPNPPCP